MGFTIIITHIMTDTFNLKSFIITTSLNERTIYLKLVDTTSFQSYETNVSPPELRLNVQLEDAYKLIAKCLSGHDNDYAVVISINTGIMKVTFNAIVGGYFKIGFEITLKEKLMSNDAQLSLNFNQLEQNQNKKVQDIMNKMDCMQQKMKEMNETMDTICNGAVINLYNTVCGSGLLPINTSVISILNDISVRWENLKYFMKLQTLVIHFHNLSCNSVVNTASNKTLTEITIELMCAHPNIVDIPLLENFPNLERITLNNGGIKVIGGYEKLVSSLNNAKSHKIKFITIKDTEVSSFLNECCIKHDIALTMVK